MSRPMHIMSIPVIWFLAHRNRFKVGWCQKQVVVFFLYHCQNSKFTGLAFVFSTVCSYEQYFSLSFNSFTISDKLTLACESFLILLFVLELIIV